MKKCTLGAIILLMSTPLFATETEPEIKSLHTQDYVNAAAELFVEAADDFVASPKEERKKRKRHFFKKVIVKIAALAVQAFANNKLNKGELDAEELEESMESRSVWTSLFCIVKLLSDLGEISEQQEDPKRIEALLRDLQELLTVDNLLEQCGRASSFLTRFKNAKTDEDWRTLAASFLRATRQAADCVSDLREVIQFYVREKCAQIVTVLFPPVTPETESA